MTRELVGVGVGLRRPHLSALLERGDRAPRVLELTPSHLFATPALLERVAAGRAIVLHDVLASLGTVGPLDLAHLDRVAEVARRTGALAYTEHIALTRSPSGLDLGHLIPLPRTRAVLDTLVEHVVRVADRLGLPVALELPTTTLRWPDALPEGEFQLPEGEFQLPEGEFQLPEGEFLAALVERSGCELILDLENLRIDAHNYADLDVERRLASWPLAAVSHVQLAGGEDDDDGVAIDSHAAPVPEPTWALLAALRGRIEPRTIIIERDGELPELERLLAEARRAEAIWRG